MKFTSQDGQEIDTDKLPDLEAAVAEQHKPLFDWMVEHDIPCLLISMIPQGTTDRMHVTINSGPKDTPNSMRLFYGVDAFFRRNGLCLYDLEENRPLFSK